MCGIAGVFNLPGSAVAVLPAMLGCLAHRGPDDDGTWFSDDNNVAMGHRRLAIIDLSSAGHQPMASANGRFVVSYNGEIYNYKALKRELEVLDAARVWRGHSDTEVLLAGFNAWGIPGTLRRCNGMFALAVWDREHQSLTLARDRMGEKPLYFGWIAGRFAFASELKAFSKVPGWQPRMDSGAISSYLGAGHVRGPQSAVQGVFRLPASSILTLSSMELRERKDWEFLSGRITQYWSLMQAAIEGVSDPVTDDASAMAQLATLLRDAVGSRMLSDVPVGAFLSGGIDSSLVVALMQEHSSHPIRTFSIGFDDPRHDEAPFAREVSKHLGTDHTELYVTPEDAMALVPELAGKFDEPFADNSQIPTLLVSSIARHQVAVALSGDGGDELFGGYGRYFAILDIWRMLAPLPAGMRRSLSPALGLIAAASGPLNRVFPGTRIRFRLERLAERLDATNPEAMRISFIAGAGSPRIGSNTRPFINPLGEVPPQLRDTLRRLMYADQVDYLPDDILHKLDRASMAFGLESRVPFLDHRVIELSWRLPTAMLLRGNEGKQPLRRVLDRYVPRRLVDRPKQGFAPPMDQWLRGRLRDWAEALLSPASLQELPCLNASAVRELWQAHQQNRVDAGTALWRVLMLADWRRQTGASL